MRERYLDMLTQLQNELMDMGMLCENAIMKTYRLLISRDQADELAEEINRMEKEIDGKEQIVESICVQLLLRQQPVASDLRRISAALKLITDLERIGDQAIDIAEIVQTGSIDIPVKEQMVAEMAETAVDMVNKSVEAFVNSDLDLARNVIDSDDRMDSLFLKVRRDLTTKSADGVFSSDQTLDLLMVAKYYERIADHATNVAEWVEFSITGIHRSGKEIHDVFSRK